MSQAIRPLPDRPPLPCPAYVLAGGQSRRFGSDKGRVSIQSQPLIVRLREQLETCGHPTYVVADRVERYAALGIECLIDAVPNAGPLAGLVTALEHCQRTHGDSWLLLLSCDLVSWHRKWSDELLAATNNAQAQATGQAIAYRSDRVQPLPALYHATALDIARQQLDGGRLALVELLCKLKLIELPAIEDPRNYAFNDYEELRRACQLDGQDYAPE